MTAFDDIVRYLYEIMIGYGYLGIFLSGLVSNLIIFIPVPYLLLVFLLGSYIETNLALISFISGMGAACGKLIIFTLSKSGRRFVGEKSLRNLEFARLILERYGFWAVFAVAATPLPDDIFYIPMGMARFASIKFFLACLFGKIILTLVVALGGRYSIGWINTLISPGSFIGIVTTVLFIMISIYATIKIDWETAFKKYFLQKKKKPFEET